MRISTLFFVSALFAIPVAAATPCKTALEHRKLDRQKIQNIQVQKVNSWKEDWRMDPRKTAQHEVAETLAPAPNRNPEMIPVAFVKGDDRTQVFSYRDADRIFEITMTKPEWLLPYSGIYKIMMWVVTDVKTTCAK